MEEIRPLQSHELEESLALSSFAFQYRLSDEEKEKKKSNLKAHEIWGCFINGKLAAQLKLYPFKVYIQGKCFPMGGIASVASWPEYRRGGWVGKLMSFALKEMKKQGQTVSMLHPFSYSLYRKYGWEACIEYKQYYIPQECFPRAGPIDGKVIRIVNPWEQWEQFDQLYQKYAQSYNGMLIREESWWKQKIFHDRSTQTAVIYYNPAGEASGYLLYEAMDNCLEVSEWITLDAQAEDQMLRFLANHDSMVKQIKLKAPIDDQTPFLLDHPRFTQEIYPYFMARVVDVPSFLSQYRFKSSDQIHILHIRITDQYAAWNEGEFQVEIHADGDVDQVNRLPETANPRYDGKTIEIIQMDIGTFTAMVFGYCRVSWLWKRGKIVGNESVVQQWGMLLHDSKPHFTDYF